jgi:NAD(P)-dependent dehydrogenase (short-subunit alcohol dehydrogenase family)
VIHLVTGGSRGIGARLVVDAARAGHDVAFTWREREDRAREVAAAAAAAGGRVRCYRLDVGVPELVERVVAEVLADFGGVDVLVNNAGISRDNLLVSMADDEWHDVLRTNLTGPFLLCREVLPAMLQRRFGRVVNVSSLVSGGGTGQANYAAAKAGLHGLTRTIAKEYGRKGITANAVVPGLFATEMTASAVPESIAGFWRSYCPVPKGRTGELAELSAVVQFLASKVAAYVNGETIRVTGGLDWGP